MEKKPKRTPIDINTINQLIESLKQTKELRNQDEKDVRNTLDQISTALEYELKKSPGNEQEIKTLQKEYEKTKQNHVISTIFLEYINTRIAFLLRLIAKQNKKSGRDGDDDEY